MFSIKSFLKLSAKNQNLSNVINKKSKFFGSPLCNVLLMVALILGVSGVFRFLEWRRINAQTQIQINDSENPGADEKTKTEKNRQSANIFGGEVIDTSRRLRETGALGFAVCLSILDEAKRQKKIPGSINALLNAVTSRGLMPPGLEIENGEIISASGKIYLRYQPQPLQIEFVSIPREARFGPALILRFPLTTADGKNIAYFQSASASSINLPKAFAPAAEIIKSGWTIEAWRGIRVGGEHQDFARMLAEEQEKLKANAHDNSDYSAR
ncbi:MAG TPA: hypothetical protein PKY82_03895 [Pyrinomonadaceae bacterium]|nr:hypothetical protein [Pyrinomonadaceae bacterium]